MLLSSFRGLQSQTAHSALRTGNSSPSLFVGFFLWGANSTHLPPELGGGGGGADEDESPLAPAGGLASALSCLLALAKTAWLRPKVVDLAKAEAPWLTRTGAVRLVSENERESILELKKKDLEVCDLLRLACDGDLAHDEVKKCMPGA